MISGTISPASSLSLSPLSSVIKSAGVLTAISISGIGVNKFLILVLISTWKKYYNPLIKIKNTKTPQSIISKKVIPGEGGAGPAEVLTPPK